MRVVVLVPVVVLVSDVSSADVSHHQLLVARADKESSQRRTWQFRVLALTGHCHKSRVSSISTKIIISLIVAELQWPQHVTNCVSAG